MDEEAGAPAELRIVGAERPGGLELRTRGLASRGLPELRVTALPPYLGQGWARVLAAVARRLAETGLEERSEAGPEERSEAGPGAGPTEGPAAPGAGCEIVLTDGVALRLAPADDEEGVLVPEPPHGHEGPVDEWRREVLIRLYPAARA